MKICGADLTHPAAWSGTRLSQGQPICRPMTVKEMFAVVSDGDLRTVCYDLSELELFTVPTHLESQSFRTGPISGIGTLQAFHILSGI